MAQKRYYLQTSNSTKICYYKNLKSKKPVYLFLHGFSGSSIAWEPIIKINNPNYIAVDLRGHGLSTRLKNKDFNNIENFVNDIHKIIQHENINRVVIVGHCFGGMIALQYMKNHPEKISKAFLINTTDDLPPIAKFLPRHKVLNIIVGNIIHYLPNVGWRGYEDYQRLNYKKDISMKRIFSDIMHTRLHSFMSILDRIIKYNFSINSNEIKINTTIILGKKDKIIPPKYSKSMAKKIKNSKTFELGSGHVAILTHPKEIANIIKY